MQNTDGLAARGSGLNGPCERRRGMGDHSVVPRKLRKWFGLWLARTCCQQATGCFPLDNPLREAQSMGVEGLRSGTKTLPWHKHPSVLDRVTLRVALSSFWASASVHRHSGLRNRGLHAVPCRCIQTPPHRLPVSRCDPFSCWDCGSPLKDERDQPPKHPKTHFEFAPEPDRSYKGP